ncbi:protein of unknown function [Micropruina glycogenica]|uniref:Uncharacterized protein n=1 Tax=Micropruina glycogenica TaxID=75385 RepID=A0A2N9JK87_9ACTN|nr:protein of unknown function [Micropruina glycogenica]
MSGPFASTRMHFSESGGYHGRLSQGIDGAITPELPEERRVRPLTRTGRGEQERVVRRGGQEGWYRGVRLVPSSPDRASPVGAVDEGMTDDRVPSGAAPG